MERIQKESRFGKKFNNLSFREVKKLSWLVSCLLLEGRLWLNEDLGEDCATLYFFNSFDDKFDKSGKDHNAYVVELNRSEAAALGPRDEERKKKTATWSLMDVRRESLPHICPLIADRAYKQRTKKKNKRNNIMFCLDSVDPYWNQLPPSDQYTTVIKKPTKIAIFT